MSQKLNLKLLESDNEIKAKIYEALAKELNKVISKNGKKISRQIKGSINTWINEQPEVAELLSDQTANSLNAQLGISVAQAQAAVLEIIRAIQSTIAVKIRPIDNKLRGGVEIQIQPSDLRNVLAVSSGTTLTLSGALPWLSWLLEAGTATIVFGYSYQPDQSGRTGGGTMTKGGQWRIPPQFSGTIDDNFITRALSRNERELTKLLQGLLE